MAVREKLGRRERFGLPVADRALPSYQNWHAKGGGGELGLLRLVLPDAAVAEVRRNWLGGPAARA